MTPEQEKQHRDTVLLVDAYECAKIQFDAAWNLLQTFSKRNNLKGTDRTYWCVDEHTAQALANAWRSYERVHEDKDKAYRSMCDAQIECRKMGIKDFPSTLIPFG